jgi:hypothetical protein
MALCTGSTGQPPPLLHRAVQTSHHRLLHRYHVVRHPVASLLVAGQHRAARTSHRRAKARPHRHAEPL